MDLELCDDPAVDSAEKRANDARNQERHKKRNSRHVGIKPRRVIGALQERSGDDGREADHAAEGQVGSLQDDDAADSEGQDEPDRALRQDIAENINRKKRRFLDDDKGDDTKNGDENAVFYDQILDGFFPEAGQLSCSGCAHTSVPLVWFRYLVAR